MMKISEYKKLYEEVVDMSMDAEEFGLFHEISKEDIEKAKWIKCIIECMNDVPLRRVKHIFEQKNIEFDSDDFLEENDF